MAFTAPTITHTFTSADGSAGAGTVEFTLLGPMTNGSSTISPTQISANLSSAGVLSQVITSNLDPATFPAAPGATQWRVDLRLLDQSQTLSYMITVPPIQTETNGSILSGDLDQVILSSLTAKSFMVGQSIAGSGIPSNTTILSIDTTTNSVTISANASAGTGLTLTLGSTIDLGALLPTADQAG